MKQGFSSEPLTRWNGSRNMILEEDFYYIDEHLKQWSAPKGSHLNGATIPRSLWTTIGSPYVGLYRRASILHDVAVGELRSDVTVTSAERRLADRMFYSACRFDGCSQRFASLLYIGVRFGSWMAHLPERYDKVSLHVNDEEMRSNDDVESVIQRYWSVADNSESLIDDEDLDAIDFLIDDTFDGE